MKSRILRLFLMACYAFPQTGCLGIEPAVSGRDFDEYMKSIKPYIEYWEKSEMTTESRRQDSTGCKAGGVTAYGVYQPELESARLPGEQAREAYVRLFRDWQRCMISKGYLFTGKCYDNEVGRTSPACAGRELEPLGSGA